MITSLLLLDCRPKYPVMDAAYALTQLRFDGHCAEIFGYSAGGRGPIGLTNHVPVSAVKNMQRSCSRSIRSDRRDSTVLSVNIFYGRDAASWRREMGCRGPWNLKEEDYCEEVAIEGMP
jgi:hypothetical protein